MTDRQGFQIVMFVECDRVDPLISQRTCQSKDELNRVNEFPQNNHLTPAERFRLEKREKMAVFFVSIFEQFCVLNTLSVT